jgi:hypothetical protein
MTYPIRNCNFSNRVNSGSRIPSRILRRSSYINLEQDKAGCSSLAICCRTNAWKAASGTKSDGDIPLAFLMATRISSSVKCSKGSIFSTDFLKI